MEELNPEILRHLRSMAHKGDTPSRMLREVIGRLAPDKPHKLTLIRYMREAFCLSLQQASPIAGWAADGSGELNDSRLDAFLLPEILMNRPAWESLDMASSG